MSNSQDALNSATKSGDGIVISSEQTDANKLADVLTCDDYGSLWDRNPNARQILLSAAPVSKDGAK